MSNKLDNTVLRYSKLKSASAALARRKSLSNLNNKTLQDWLRQVVLRASTSVNLSVGLRRKRQTVVDVPQYRPRQIFVGM